MREMRAGDARAALLKALWMDRGAWLKALFMPFNPIKAMRLCSARHIAALVAQQASLLRHARRHAVGHTRDETGARKLRASKRRKP